MNEHLKQLEETIDNVLFPSKEGDGIEHVDESYKGFKELIKNALLKAYELGVIDGKFHVCNFAPDGDSCKCGRKAKDTI